MADLNDFLKQLAGYEAAGNHEGVRAVRMRIVDECPATEAAAEAAYKLGVHELVQERRLEKAVSFFEEACLTPKGYWTQTAQTSLALCHYRQGFVQKALLGLRKIGYVEKASEHSVSALMLLESLLLKEQKTDEAKRVRQDRIKQLQGLVKAGVPGFSERERGFFLYLLGLALVDERKLDDAKQAFTQAKALGEEVLGSHTYQQVCDWIG